MLRSWLITAAAHRLPNVALPVARRPGGGSDSPLHPWRPMLPRPSFAVGRAHLSPTALHSVPAKAPGESRGRRHALTQRGWMDVGGAVCGVQQWPSAPPINLLLRHPLDRSLLLAPRQGRARAQGRGAVFDSRCWLQHRLQPAEQLRQGRHNVVGDGTVVLVALVLRSGPTRVKRCALQPRQAARTSSSTPITPALRAHMRSSAESPVVVAGVGRVRRGDDMTGSLRRGATCRP